MNLPDFSTEEELKRQRDQMGAEFRTWNLGGGGWSDLDQILANTGTDIHLGETKILGDGTFVYKDRRVAVYIRDQYGSSNSASEPEKLNRVHVVYCDTLQHMQRKGKYEVRYVATTRTDGMFVVNFLGQFGSGVTADGVECRLYVCIKCLKRLNYKNYIECASSECKEIKESFNLGKFFEEYGSRIDRPPT